MVRINGVYIYLYGSKQPYLRAFFCTDMQLNLSLYKS
jgi:hypothetical protein